jgi:LacI family transcriptional regulator
MTLAPLRIPVKKVVDAGKAMDELLAHPGERPTAVVAGNDRVALRVIRRLRVHGLRCPEGVSVAGFNDMPLAEDFWPPPDDGTYVAARDRR